MRLSPKVFDKLTARTARHEGFRSKVYLDSVGKETIGYGWCIERGLTEPEARFILQNQLGDCYQSLRSCSKGKLFDSLNEETRSVLTELCFNLGLGGLLNFKKMWAAIDKGDFVEAAREALDSRWAKQVKGRATTLSDILRDSGGFVSDER